MFESFRLLTIDTREFTSLTEGRHGILNDLAKVYAYFKLGFRLILMLDVS